MAKIKGNGNPLSHQDMDENFQEINTINARVGVLESGNQQMTEIMNALHAANESRISELEARVTALQAELDTNQQSAENILNGIISRLNITKSQVITYRDEYQNLYNELNSQSSGSEIENLILQFIQAIITELNNTITDIDAQIALLSENFTI